MLDKIQRIDINSSDYPRRLREIPDPPEKLYCAGDISLLNADSISVVGSRKYTLYGKTVPYPTEPDSSICIPRFAGFRLLPPLPAATAARPFQSGLGWWARNTQRYTG